MYAALPQANVTACATPIGTMLRSQNRYDGRHRPRAAWYRTSASSSSSWQLSSVAEQLLLLRWSRDGISRPVPGDSPPLWLLLTASYAPPTAAPGGSPSVESGSWLAGVASCGWTRIATAQKVAVVQRPMAERVIGYGKPSPLMMWLLTTITAGPKREYAAHTAITSRRPLHEEAAEPRSVPKRVRPCSRPPLAAAAGSRASSWLRSSPTRRSTSSSGTPCPSSPSCSRRHLASTSRFRLCSRISGLARFGRSPARSMLWSPPAPLSLTPALSCADRVAETCARLRET
mmetsp:Transcript_43310/g.140907  ORF Transcript_43310/g.140907 Transcript_43310/m.140907 type:complete len:288 (-) Transcript_43310:109-972(-)